MPAAVATGMLPLIVFTLRPLAAQSGFGISPMAQAIGTVDYVNPIPGTGSLTEARIVQPVLMAMGHAFDGHVLLNATLNLEGLTIPDGELTPGEWGEGFVDRRHPHTYVHELLLSWIDPLGKLDGPGRLGLVVGKGFVPFGTDDPMSRPFLRYPVNHHLSQILERAVGIVQYQLGPATLEGALFDGDEPTGPASWPLLRSSDGTWRFGDSRAARLSLRPVRSLELQGSLAHIHSPESRNGGGPDDNKQSLSARWDVATPTTERYAELEWARTSELGGVFVYHSVLGEVMYARNRWQLSYRFEDTERPEEQRLSDPFRTLRPDPDYSTLGTTRWTLHTLHLAYDALPRARRLEIQPFVEVTLGSVAKVGPGVFDPAAFYGTTSVRALSVGVLAAWGVRGHRMGRYGVLSQGRAGMSM